MIGLLQRVTSATVAVDNEVIGKIGRGLLVLVAVHRDDQERDAARLAERILTYRVFPDSDDRMNCSLLDEQLGLLLVPQFTLAADTGKGMRPSFSSAADAETGSALFDAVVDIMKREYNRVQTGCFGADMSVQLVNDGPVTFWLQS